MFLDDFCNDREGWGPINDDKNDLTPCAQSIILFAPVNLIFIILGIISIISMVKNANKIKTMQLQHRLSIISSNMERSGGISICNFDLVFSFLFSLGFSYGLITAIILPQTNSKDKINYVIWSLSWFLCSWIVYTILFYMERRYVQIYGMGDAPSTVVRWFWVIQFVLCLKNMESVLVANYVNNTIDIKDGEYKGWYYFELFAIIPFTLLLLRAVFLKPLQSEEETGFDSKFYPSKLSMQNFGGSLQNQYKQLGNDDSMDPSQYGASFDFSRDGRAESLIPDKDEYQPRKYKKTMEETANLFSILTFGWLSKLFTTGYNRKKEGKALEMEDLDYLRGTDHAHESVKLFYQSWRGQLKKAKDKNIKHRIKEGLEDEDDHKVDVNVIDNKAPLLARQLSDDTKMPTHEKIDKDAKYKASLLRAILNAFGTQFFIAGPLKLIYDCFQYAGPVVLSAYLSDATKLNESNNKDSLDEAYLYAVLLFVTYMCGTFILAQYFHRCFRAGMRVRAGLMAACYEKALKLTQSARSEKTAGEIMTIVTVDVRKIRDVFPYCWMLISAPFQICIAVYLLYQQIGWSVFIGIAAQTLFMAPLQTLVGVSARKLQKQVQKVRDKRMEVVNEVFGAMKIIKMYAWEMSFGNKITNIRNEELAILRCYVWWYTIMILFWGWAPTLVSLTAFVAYTANGGELTAEKAFTSIALFNLLRFPLAMLPMVTISFIDANNSLRRIREFLSANEIDPNIIEYTKIEGNKSYETKLKGGGPPSKISRNGNQQLLSSSFNDEPVEIEQKHDDDEEKEGNGKSPAIRIEDATFTWDDEMNQAALININLQFKHGTTTMVIGETGSGKSALLRAILGNLTKANGKIIYGESRLDVGQHIRVAYSSQVAWIQNAKLKDNILFGNNYNEKLYNRVIESCALIDDLKILPGGDQTEIGEKGINLSGGQKQRISLARAVYSNADVYVFDDPLSAVDSHVANHIFNQCFLDLLKGKTIVLATHAVSFLKYADNIIVMDQGKIKLEGQLQDLIDAKVNLTKFIIHKNEEENKEDEDEEEENALLGSPKSPRRQKSTESEKSSPKKDDKKKGKDGKLVDEEERGKGDVSFAVYWLYIKAAGGICLFLMYILFLSSYYGSNQIATFWLAFWSDRKIGSKDMSNKSEWWWLDIYTALQMASLLMLFSSAVMALITRLRASKYLHESLLAKMLHAPMSFFDTTPIGRIINRFARDMYAIDQAVPGSYQSALRITIYLFATALGVCIVTPYFAAILVILGPFYYYLQKYFITTSRELRRLSTLQNSPIYSNFSESIAGQDILRSFNKTNEFSTKNKDMIDKDHQAYYPSVAANRWLAIRLEFIGNCLIGAAALFCAITQPPAGLVGVALSTIMSVTQGLNWFVRQKAQLEQDIVSVERIDQYANDETPQERPYILKQNRPQKDWPSKGEITFNNVWMRYRPGLEYVLKGLSFDVAPGEKVGVIGRTGAGKSSLFVTLLRIVEIETEVNNQSCQVVVDGIDVSQIGLQDLRSKMSVIPQDPILFTGTVRFNLDPFNPHTLKLDKFLQNQQMNGLQSELKKNEIKTVEDLYKLTNEQVNEKFHGNSKQSVIELKQYLDQYDNDLIEALKLAHCYDALKKMVVEVTLKKERDEQDKKDKEEKEKQAKKDKKNKKKQKEEKKTTKTNGMHGEKSKGLLSDSLRENSISKFNVSQYMDNPKYRDLNPLDITVEENGSNFSVGQRQLLCLARAIVRRSTILLLDEATSAVDPSTDQLIQETIRNVFKSNTILTIAHRIDTILDYDRILIMDKGKVLEYDKPQALLSNEKSRFSEIVQESFGVNLDDVLSKKLGKFNNNNNNDDNDDNDDLAIQEETNENENEDDNTPN